jgi:hypothetical protein
LAGFQVSINGRFWVSTERPAWHLSTDRAPLFVIDGSKALREAIRDVFGCGFTNVGCASYALSAF